VLNRDVADALFRLLCVLVNETADGTVGLDGE
jgi:hypothetical protein